VAIIARGEKVVDGTLAEVKRSGGGRHVALAFHRNQEAAARVLGDKSLVSRVDDFGASAEARLLEGVESDRLLGALVSAGVGISRFEVVEPSLNSVFVSLVGAEAASAPAREDA
jgi:ABC-2 type transport system ATP-binding protein